MFLVCNFAVTTFETAKPSSTGISRWSMFTVSFGMIQQQFSLNENKKLILSASTLCSDKFRRFVHNNTTLCTHFSNLLLVRARHLSMTQQSGAVPNLRGTNCSRAPSVVRNPHFILAHLVYINRLFEVVKLFVPIETPRLSRARFSVKKWEIALSTVLEIQ